jgi:hypothetical protein
MTHSFSSDEIAQASGTLLSDLEASLADSQQSLLCRDFARLEQCTREQIGSHRSLEILWLRNICDPASVTALRAAQLRVLRAARVQAALLTRAQRWLRTLANLVAGPEANYSAPVSSGQGPHPAPYLFAPYLAWPSANRSNPADLTTREEDSEDKERNQCPA